MSVARRTVVAYAGGASLFGILRSYNAKAADFTFKLGHDQTTQHPLHRVVTQAAAKISEESGGRLVIRVYPNNQLGSDTQMFAQLRSGALELMVLGDNILGQVVPSANIATLPFVFSSYKEAWAAMDSPFGGYVNAQTEKLGLKTFNFWEGGFRHVFTSPRPIMAADDFKGLKLRVPEAPIEVLLFKTLGASPTPIDTSEVYSALQTRLVDGGETVLETIEYQKFWEVCKYISLTAHQATAYSVMAHGLTFQRLPKDLQEVLTRNLDASAAVERTAVATGEDDTKATLRNQGVTIVTPDRASMREAVQRAGLYPKWRDTYGAEPFSLLEKIVGKLT